MGHLIDTSVATDEQPSPTESDHPAVWPQVIEDVKGIPLPYACIKPVIEDMGARDEVGRERYGTPLQPFNGRDALVDAYQEALDLGVYLKQARIEGVEDLDQAYATALGLVVGLRAIIGQRST